MPAEIVLALMLLETEHRPPWFQAVEARLFKISAALFQLAGTPILNLSVGPAQVKVSTALRLLLGLSFEGDQYFLHPPRALKPQIAQVVADLLDDQSNVAIAAKYVSQLTEQYRTARQDVEDQSGLSENFLAFLSASYTGTLWASHSGAQSDSLHAELLIRLVRAEESLPFS